MEWSKDPCEMNRNKLENNTFPENRTPSKYQPDLPRIQ